MFHHGEKQWELAQRRVKARGCQVGIEKQAEHCGGMPESGCAQRDHGALARRLGGQPRCRKSPPAAAGGREPPVPQGKSGSGGHVRDPKKSGVRLQSKPEKKYEVIRERSGEHSVEKMRRY